MAQYNQILLNMKSHRVQLGLKQEQLGNLVRVSAQSISNIESGRCIPRKRTLEKIMGILRYDDFEKKAACLHFYGDANAVT